MAERAETDLLARALNGLSKNAQRDLALVFLGYESNAELLKTEIPQVWESLLEKYGSASSELGAQMFEQWAARIDIDSPGVKRVRAVDPERARARLEWALSSKSPRENLMVLVDELVKQPARSTLAASADANGVKFARVPSGSETCAFCFMLASRGAVYLSEAKAGKMNKFHGKCDCQIVPVRGPQDYPEGYHPDAMYDDYARARDKVAPEGQPIRVNEVLSQMRLDLHDQLRDGVEPPEVKAARLSEEAKPKLGAEYDSMPVKLNSSSITFFSGDSYLEKNGEEIIAQYRARDVAEFDQVISVPVAALDDVISAGGLRNVHETKKRAGGSGKDYMKARLRVEHGPMGIPEGTAPHDMPIYGWLDAPTTAKRTDKYGPIQLVLKENLKGRSTVSYQDSLDGGDRGAGTAVVPILEAKTAPLEDLARAGMNLPVFVHNAISKESQESWRPEYFETQVFGGVSLDDVQMVRIVVGGGGASEAEAKKAAEKLQAIGLEVEMVTKQ